MKGWFRRVRATLGMGAIWGFAATIIGTVAGVAAGVARGLPLIPSFLSWGLGWGMGSAALGFVLGSTFAVLLTTLERRRTLDELTPRRAAMWGALPGAAAAIGWYLVSLALGAPWTAIPLAEALPPLLVSATLYGSLSAGLAAGTVWAARRAPGQIASGSDMADGRSLGPVGHERATGPDPMLKP